MRLPTEQEQQQIRDNNKRVLEGFAAAAPVARDIKKSFDAFRDVMAKIRLDSSSRP